MTLLGDADRQVAMKIGAFPAAYAKGIPQVGLGQPKYQPGERTVLRLLRCTSRRMAIDADSRAVEAGAFGDDGRKLKTEGMMMTTTERVMVVGNFGKVVSAWWWRDLREVRVLPGYRGVRLVRHDDTGSADVLLHVYGHTFGAPDFATVATTFFDVEYAWVLATGQDAQAWTDQVVHRLQD